MPPLVHQPAAEHLADLIDAVGELIAAILHMHARVAVGEIASVDVGDAGHDRAGPQVRQMARWMKTKSPMISSRPAIMPMPAMSTEPHGSAEMAGQPPEAS